MLKIEGMHTILSIMTFLVVPMLALARQPFESFFRNEQGLMREKLYLHTDKPYYAAGDTIWFRGTLVNADTHSFLVKTNYIYVELLSRNDSLISRQKLKRDGLCFHNCIPLDADLPDGDYVLRGYTEWMRNFDSCFFAEKELAIRNAMSKETGKKVKSYDYAVTFLPEGGPLLGGVRQRVAFIAQRSDGHSEEVKGVIRTEQGETLCHFETRHKGMGTVECEIPAQGKLIAETVSLQNGKEKIFTLPEIVRSGIALRVDTKGDSLLHIDCLTSGQALDGLQVVTHARGICTGVFSYIGDTLLSTRQWPDGINQVLVCSERGDVLSRRLVFVDNEIRSNQWKIESEHPLYDKRERVQIDFCLKDEKGNPLVSDCSVSLTDSSKIIPDKQCDNIVSDLLLTSELKGRIEDPGWYFEAGSNRQRELDLVMLTHGWSRFETSNLRMPNVYTLSYQIEDTQYISGRVEGIPEAERNNLIGIYNPDEKKSASAVLQRDGTFCLAGLDFVDSTYFGVRLLSKKKMYRKILFDKPTYPGSNYRSQNFVVDTLYNKVFVQRDYLKGDETMVYLPDILVKEKKRSRLVRDHFFAESLDLKELQEAYDPNEVVTLSDLIHRMMKTTHNGLFFPAGTTSVYDGQVNLGGYSAWGRLMILLTSSGSRFYGVDMGQMLERIYLYDIDRVEFLPRYQGAGSFPVKEEEGYLRADDSGSFSALLVRFKKGHGFSQGTPDPRKRVIWPKGYACPAYFYHPAYDTEEKKQQPRDDKRTTLYWNPSVQTDKEGKGSIAFYTSDSPRNYTLTIEGVTIDGKPVYWQQTLF